MIILMDDKKNVKVVYKLKIVGIKHIMLNDQILPKKEHNEH